MSWVRPRGQRAQRDGVGRQYRFPGAVRLPLAGNTQTFLRALEAGLPQLLLLQVHSQLRWCFESQMQVPRVLQHQGLQCSLPQSVAHAALCGQCAA